jgi:hypothetical protein
MLRLPLLQCLFDAALAGAVGTSMLRAVSERAAANLTAVNFDQLNVTKRNMHRESPQLVQLASIGIAISSAIRFVAGASGSAFRRFPDPRRHEQNARDRFSRRQHPARCNLRTVNSLRDEPPTVTETGMRAAVVRVAFEQLRRALEALAG